MAGVQIGNEVPPLIVIQSVFASHCDLGFCFIFTQFIFCPLREIFKFCFVLFFKENLFAL